MYLTRQETTTKLPIKRKGTKYIARASSHLESSVPVVIAVRDMLKAAQNAREVKQMIKSKTLKINGRPVRDYRESIKLFNIFEADHPYKLVLSETGKFMLEKTSDKERLCKIVNKSLLSKGHYQLNFHDGSNVLTKENMKTGDSVYLDFSGKIKSHSKLEKGKSVFIISGKYLGQHGKIESVHDSHLHIKFKDKEAVLDKSCIIVQ
jgi:small subunit ribosomal protein S4e